MHSFLSSATTSYTNRCDAFKMTEKELLENLFDSLDRLFDRHCRIYDVHDLMVATDVALKSLGSTFKLTECINELKPIIRSERSEEDKREQALIVTDSLRFKLSDLLPID